jgi:uroporphyrinogen-III decarboxylase
MVRNQGRILLEPERVDGLAVPEPWNTPRFLRFVQWRRELGRRFGDAAVGGIAGQEGPVTTAGLLRGEQFFVDCAMDRSRAHRLLSIVTETLITFTRASREVEGVSPRTVGIADDYSGLIGPEMWPELVLPYYRRIIEALGPDGCWMHTELVRREHLPLFRELPLTGLNFAEDQYLTPRDMMEMGPDVPWGWHILTVSEMQQGKPESIRCRYRELVDMGVREVRCELTVNTPAENVRAFLSIARELE